MMSTEIKIKSQEQFLMYLRTSKVYIEDYVYKEDPEKNKFGLKDIPYYINPYMWSIITEKNLYPAIEFLLKYKQDWLTLGVSLGILQSLQTKYSKFNPNFIPQILKKVLTSDSSNIDTILISIVTTRGNRMEFLSKVFNFIKKHELTINPDGAFMKACLTELVKSNDKKCIEYILEKFPDTINKCESWPYLIAIKYGYYELALFFASKGMNIHAKNDLGYKLLERNYKKNLVHSVGNVKRAEEQIMDLYSMDSRHSNKV